MAETITSEVVGKVNFPAGAGPDGAAAPSRRYTAHVSRPFSDTAPEIQASGRDSGACARAAGRCGLC